MLLCEQTVNVYLYSSVCEGNSIKSEKKKKVRKEVKIKRAYLNPPLIFKI